MKTLLTTLHSKYIHASLALPYLAVYCDDGCGEIVIGEYSVNEPKELLLSRLLEWHANVVCFSVYVWNRVVTFELVKCLKRINPEQKIVLGGPEVSFESGDFFNHYPVDALICGEGEIPLRHVLSAWQQGQMPSPLAGLLLPGHPPLQGQNLLSSLDDIPSPFAAGKIDFSKKLVYYESSRGCPYSCSFCMSALDERVRSFSLERIRDDLKNLLANRVDTVKFVDRTFNYDNRRSREIFSYLLEHNISSRFHFEIGAHLLDKETLRLLESVPEGMFQFEIGVQSTLPETLKKIGRTASLERLEENVRYLRQKTKIHLHLDLIAGLPGEDYSHCLRSIDRVLALRAGHLQIEPVKLLPGAPLRQQVMQWGIVFDPSPPYTILKSAFLSFFDLERLRGIGKLVDLLINSGRFNYLLPQLVGQFASPSCFLEDLDRYWRGHSLYFQHRSLRQLYLEIDKYLLWRFADETLALLREALSRDFAHHERVVGGSEPPFFTCDLSSEEQQAVRLRVREEVAVMNRTGKIQFFAAVYHYLGDSRERKILIFLYESLRHSGLHVTELELK